MGEVQNEWEWERESFPTQIRSSLAMNSAGNIIGLTGGEGKKVSASVYGKTLIIFEDWKLVWRTKVYIDDSIFIIILIYK